MKLGLGLFGSGATFRMASLFAGGEDGIVIDRLNPSSGNLFQDAAGTTPVTAAGQPVGRALDTSGNDNHVTQSVNDDYRPTLMQDTNGVYYIDHDEIDDELTVTLPNLGSACTVAYVNESQITLLENQTISGAYTLPETGLRGFLLIDRALPLAEQIRVIRYFARLVPGVSYAGVNSRLALICLNAVDVFVYDAGEDDDGGAWTTDYAQQMAVVAEATAVKIYDATTPDLPLLTTLDFTGYTVTSVAAASGVLSVGTTTGLASFNLADGDETVALDYTTGTSPAIVNNAINDVAMTVMPGAPTDPATGLPVPTIAVATNGGVSVIKDDGSTVVHSAATGAAYRAAINETRLEYQQAGVGQFLSRDLVGVGASWSPTTTLTSSSTPATKQAVASSSVLAPETAGGTSGLTLVAENTATPAASMVAYITKDYNTGWMPGDIKGCWLSSTDATSLVGGTDADRSVNGIALNVTGTITRSPVAEGAELVGYSGFSGSNYLEQPYNSALDFGTGDFSIIGWFKTTSSDLEGLFERRNGASGTSITLHNAYGVVRGTIRSAIDIDAAAGSANTGAWTHVCFQRLSGTLYLYVNGVLAGSATNTTDLTLASSTVVLGAYADKTQPAAAASLSEWRASATALSADQIAKIYADELPLFQDRAACTLYGTSDAVTALAYDEGTALLHVGTSSGRSVFRGLERTSNTTTPVTKTISAHKGLILEK